MNKLLVVGLVGLFASSAFAETNKANSLPIVKLAQVSRTVSQATVSEEGVLDLTHVDGSVTQKQLSSEATYLIVSLANRLANAEIKVTKTFAICMMMPLLNAQNLFVSGANQNTGDFNGVLRLVLTPMGCWTTSHTAPVNADDFNAATELKDLVRVLAAENDEQFVIQ